MKNKYLLMMSFLMVCILSKSEAQDINFSQFYNNPLALNPALAGTNSHWRLASSYRNQWVNVPGNYGTNTASFDYNLDYYHTGLGIMLMSDRALGGRFGAFQTSRLSLVYCYYILLGNGWMARAGLEGNFTYKSVNLDKLTFEDELNIPTLGLGGGATFDPVVTANSDGNLNKMSGDINAGLMFYNSRFWFGASFNNLMNPFGNAGYDRYLADSYPLRFSGQMGAKIPLNHDGEVAVAPALLFNKQRQAHQLDIGVNFHAHLLRFGAWYRGFIKTVENQNSAVPAPSNQDAFVIYGGLKYQGLQVGYSYDYSISELRGTGGTHEISLIIQPWYDRRSKKGTEHIDCPLF